MFSDFMLMVVAVVLLLVGSLFDGGPVPVKHPRVGADGVVLHVTDGSISYDMERYQKEEAHYHNMTVTALSLWIAGGVFLFLAAVMFVVRIRTSKTRRNPEDDDEA